MDKLVAVVIADAAIAATIAKPPSNLGYSANIDCIPKAPSMIAAVIAISLFSPASCFMILEI